MHVDGKGFLDELDGDNQLQVAFILLYMSPHAAKWTTGDRDRIPRAYGRVRRKRCVLRADPEGVHLLFVHRQRRLAIAHNIDNARGLHDRKPFIGGDINKYVSRKERMLNFPPYPILPSPHNRVERQKGLNLLGPQLSMDKLLMTRRRVNRKPGLLCGIQNVVACFDRSRFQPSIRNRGNNEHSIPPCQERLRTHPGVCFPENDEYLKN